MQTVPCPHCAEPVRPTATFCLACDRRIVDTDRGLSVAAPVTASVGRPLLGVGVAVACVALLGGVVYGGVRLFQHAHAASTDQAESDVRHGLELVVAAEDGRSGACHALAPLLAEQVETTLSECRAIVGDDSGARLAGVTVDAPRLGNGTGTARVEAKVEDAGGTRTVDEVVHLVQERRSWRMQWNGRPVASPRAG